ncbi:hypothetical protein [uncultured Sulfitobacter sp.]|uniref:hypothetical protein n=1 Tax=uncultured Sulfitobacter sp. TaxID=191468 RepID=UPI0030D7CD5D
MIREEMAFFEKTFTAALYQITQLPEVKQSRFIDITGNVTQADIIKRTLDKYQPQHAVCLMVEPVDFFRRLCRPDQAQR